MNKWKELWKRYRYVAIVLLAGIVLMLLPTRQEDGDRTESGEAAFSLSQTEQRMETLLGKMSGVGRVQVMLTLKNGSQLELAQDTDESLSQSEQRSQSQPLTLNRGSGYQDVVVTQETYPVYLGAVVVCQGAGSSSVRLAVTEAVAALTGLTADRIRVVQWNT